MRISNTLSAIRYYAITLFNHLKNGILQVMASNVLNKMIAMFSNMVITRLMTKSDYGIWSYVCNVYSYLTLVTGLGLISGALQFGAENKGRKEEFQYYKFCLEAGLIIDTVLIVVFLIATCFVTFKIEQATPYIRAISAVLFLEYALNIFLNILRCENRIKEYAKALNINTIMSAAFTCTGAIFGVWGLVTARYFSVIVSLMYITAVIKPEMQKIIHTARIAFCKTASLWRFSLTTGASAAMNGILYLLDVTMIATLIGDSEIIATYRIATLIPNALTFIPVSVVTAILPNVIYNKDNRAWLKKRVRQTYFSLAALNFLLVGLLVLFANQVILVINGKQYLSAVPALRVLALGYFVSGTFRTLSVNLLAAKHYVGFNLMISIVSIVCDVVFNWLFIQRTGMMGAAYATFLVEFVTALMGFTFLVYVVYVKKENTENAG